MNKKFRSGAVYQTGAKLPINREMGTIAGVSAMQIGPALGHGSYVDDITINQIAELGNKQSKGVKVRFTHPGMCSDGLGKMLGRMSNFRVENDKVVGDFTAGKYAKQKSLDHIMTLAEEDPEAFGMSVVIETDFVYKVGDDEIPYEVDDNGRPIVPDGAELDDRGDPAIFIRPAELRAVDFVDEPAANRDGLFSEAFDGTSNQDANEAFAILDQFIDKYNFDASQVADFVGRYFNHRDGVLPSQKPAAPAAANEESLMDIKEVHALAAKHPASAEAILSLAAEGKTEAEITQHLSALELSQAKELAEGLQTKLDEANTAKEELSAKIVDLEAQLADLKKLSATQDPGPDSEKKLSMADYKAGKATPAQVAAVVRGELTPE